MTRAQSSLGLKLRRVAPQSPRVHLVKLRQFGSSPLTRWQANQLRPARPPIEPTQPRSAHLRAPFLRQRSSLADRFPQSSPPNIRFDSTLRSARGCDVQLYSQPLRAHFPDAASPRWLIDVAPQRPPPPHAVDSAVRSLLQHRV